MSIPIATFTDQSLATQVAQSIHLMQQERNRRRSDLHLDPLPLIPGTVTYIPVSYTKGGVKTGDVWVIDGPEGWNFQVHLSDGGNVQVPPSVPTDYYAHQLTKYPLKNKYVTPNGYYNLLADDLDTTQDQITSDKLNAQSGNALIPLYTLDDIVPYTGQRLLSRQLSDTWGYLANQETAQVSQALRTTDLAASAIISSQTVTDPLGTQLLHNILGSAVATSVSSGKTNLSSSAVNYMDNTPIQTVLTGAGLDLSATLTPTQIAQIGQTKDQLASSTAKQSYDDPLLTAQNKLDAEGEDLYYWEGNYPTVVLRPDDNPQLDPRFLYEDWPSFAGNPPLVNVQVTPRQKQAPSMGFLGAHSWISSIVGIIPVVGQVASVAISLAAANDRDAYLRNFMGAAVVTDPFKPQLFPKPFFVVLPLDLAQIAVHQPWWVVPMVKKFHNDLTNAQLGLAQRLMNQGNVQQSVSALPSGGLPQNLTPGSTTGLYDPALYSDNQVTSQLMSQHNRGGLLGAGISPSSQLAGGGSGSVVPMDRVPSQPSQTSPAMLGILTTVVLAMINSK